MKLESMTTESGLNLQLYDQLNQIPSVLRIYVVVMSFLGVLQRIYSA